MKKLLLFILLSVIVLNYFPHCYAEDNSSPFKVLISVPQLMNGERAIMKKGYNRPYFHVIIKNISDKPQRLPTWNAEDSLSFEMLMDGKEYLLKDKKITILSGMAGYFIIDPQEQLVIDVYFTADEWENFPEIPVNSQKEAQLKAIYEIPSSELAEEYGAWAGKVESKPMKVKIIISSYD